MCRTGGRRCPGQEDGTRRDAYNAKRRIVRNQQRAQRAKSAGDETKAAYYAQLETQARADLEATQERTADTFADSVVRTPDGHLLTAHHGSATPFDHFDPAHTGTGNDTWGSGFYFTGDEETARGCGEHVKSVVLNITHPIHVDGKATAGIDQNKRFSADESAAILRRHPRIHAQPDDEDNPNPLGDYDPQYWNRDSWSDAELDAMATQVAHEHFDDAPWSSLEATFDGAETDTFRRAVHDATGHDGVIVDFGDDGTSYVAWFPEQVRDAHDVPATESSPAGQQPDTNAAGQERCENCGQYGGTGHACPQRAARDELRTLSAEWRSSWSDDEAEAFDDYSGIEHYDINAKLRGDNTNPLTNHERDVVTHLTSVLERAPRATKPHLLDRGMQFKDADAATSFADAHPVGSTITLHAPTSTTTDRSVAETFAGTRSEFAKSGVIITHETTQAAYTRDSAESEVLLAPGTSFTVTARSTETIEGRTIEHLHVRETPPTSAPNSTSHPLANGPEEPVDFTYMRNPQSLASNQAANHYFGQDIEPAGRYMSENSGFTPDGWESGTVTFDRPLRIDHGPDDYAAPASWKQRLSAHYDGKSGKALSAAIRADGYDAIITSDKYGTGEVVDLTGAKPASKRNAKTSKGV